MRAKLISSNNPQALPYLGRTGEVIESDGKGSIVVSFDDAIANDEVRFSTASDINTFEFDGAGTVNMKEPDTSPAGQLLNPYPSTPPADFKPIAALPPNMIAVNPTPPPAKGTPGVSTAAAVIGGLALLGVIYIATR